MVCLGNICRSPLAEGIFRKYLKDKNFIIDSAGTASYHVGNSPDQRSVDLGQKNNINIKDLKSREFIKDDFKIYDHIYVMDKKNLHDVLMISDSVEFSKKVKLLINKKEIPDPYFGGIKEFNDCYKLIDIACKGISSNLLENE